VGGAISKKTSSTPFRPFHDESSGSRSPWYTLPIQRSNSHDRQRGLFNLDQPELRDFQIRLHIASYRNQIPCRAPTSSSSPTHTVQIHMLLVVGDPQAGRLGFIESRHRPRTTPSSRRKMSTITAHPGLAMNVLQPLPTLDQAGSASSAWI
jgi:hypothetical protein